MKVIKQEMVTNGRIEDGHFNDCEHLFVDIEAGRNQTISCRLPNGKFVTFAFISSKKEFDCVDIHSTVGPKWNNDNTLGKQHWQQHLIGFSDKGGNSFYTPQLKEKTTLATLLLSEHYFKV